MSRLRHGALPQLAQGSVGWELRADWRPPALKRGPSSISVGTSASDLMEMPPLGVKDGTRVKRAWGLGGSGF